MLDQTDRMSAVSNWQIYHLTRDQKGKSEGQKCNIYNAVSRWMHTKHLISRPLKSLAEECLQHTREVLLECPPFVSNMNKLRGKHFLICSSGTATILEIHFHATNISSSQLLPSFPLIPPGTTKIPPSIFPTSDTFPWKETNMIRMAAGFRKEERINRTNSVLSLIHTRRFEHCKENTCEKIHGFS